MMEDFIQVCRRLGRRPSSEQEYQQVLTEIRAGEPTTQVRSARPVERRAGASVSMKNRSMLTAAVGHLNDAEKSRKKATAKLSKVLASAKPKRSNEAGSQRVRVDWDAKWHQQLLLYAEMGIMGDEQGNIIGRCDGVPGYPQVSPATVKAHADRLRRQTERSSRGLAPGTQRLPGGAVVAPSPAASARERAFAYIARQRRILR